MFLRLLLLVTVLFNTVVSAQSNYTDIGNFSVRKEVNDDGYVPVISKDKGTTMIEGGLKTSNGERRKPTFYVEKSYKNGNHYSEFYFGYVNFSYDDSGNDANYFKLEFIFDVNMDKKIVAKGHVYNKHGWSTIDWGSDTDAYIEFFNTLSVAKYLYVRTSAGGNTSQVFKISLDQFGEAIKLASRVAKAGSSVNPFDSKNDNPFQG